MDAVVFTDGGGGGKKVLAPNPWAILGMVDTHPEHMTL